VQAADPEAGNAALLWTNPTLATPPGLQSQSIRVDLTARLALIETSYGHSIARLLGGGDAA
jgi:hypothetical protein